MPQDVVDIIKANSTITTVDTNENIGSYTVATGTHIQNVSIRYQVVVGTNIVKFWLYTLKSGGTDPAPAGTTDTTFGNSDAQLLDSGTADKIGGVTDLALESGDIVRLKIRSGGTAPAAGAAKGTITIYAD